MAKLATTRDLALIKPMLPLNPPHKRERVRRTIEVGDWGGSRGGAKVYQEEEAGPEEQLQLLVGEKS